MNINTIRVVTRQHLELISSGIQSDYEGDKFEPTADIPFQSIFLLTGITDDLTISFSDTSQNNLIMQITLNYPSQEGTFKIEEKASEIISHFDRGLVLEKDGLKIRVEKTPNVQNLQVSMDREIRAISIALVVYD